MDVDTIILAGGRGTRLRGVVPAYHKPLAVIDGQALLVSMIRQVRECVGSMPRIIVVVAPENTAPIANLLQDAGELTPSTYLIVQPSPAGPGDAFLIGAELATTEHVLLLMADNLFGPTDISAVLHGSSNANVVIGVRKVSDPEVARHFTRVTRTATYEGPDIDNSQRMNADFQVWLGPLRVHKNKLIEELAGVQSVKELMIGPWLANVGQIEIIHAQTHDVGDPLGPLNGD